MSTQDDLQFEPEPTGSSSQRADQTKRDAALHLLKHIQQGIASAIALLEGGESPATAKLALMQVTKQAEVLTMEGVRVVEGVFDGTSCIGKDGARYVVPPNYASKSLLVEGDVLKLTIQADGACIFKQIGPVERKRLVGTIVHDVSTGEPLVRVGTTSYKVLDASARFYKAEAGDEAVILVPKGSRTVWAALEQIFKR